MMQIAEGYFEGGSAQNIEVGFYPSYVRMVNLTETGTPEEFFAATIPIIRFDDGDNAEIKAGYTVQASDGGWSAIVRDVVLTGGSWGSGAAGYLILEPGTLDGESNIADNDVIRVATQKGGTPAGDWGDVVGAGLVNKDFSIKAALDEGTANETIDLYTGSSGVNSRGFSVGSAIGAANDLIYWLAIGSGGG